MSNRDCVHLGSCQFGIVSIREGLHSGIVSIRDRVHSSNCSEPLILTVCRTFAHSLLLDTPHDLFDEEKKPSLENFETAT